MEIEYISWGIGNRYKDKITLHKALLKPKWKLLHDEILKHELAHTDKPFSLYDYLHDFKDIPSLERIKFIIENPSTLYNLLPVYYDPKDNVIHIDTNMTIAYTLLFTLIGLFSYAVL